MFKEDREILASQASKDCNLNIYSYRFFSYFLRRLYAIYSAGVINRT